MEQAIDLKTLRGDLSQKEFADRLGVTQATICRWEKKGVTRYARLLIEQRMHRREKLEGQGATVS